MRLQRLPHFGWCSTPPFESKLQPFMKDGRYWPTYRHPILFFNILQDDVKKRHGRNSALNSQHFQCHQWCRRYRATSTLAALEASAPSRYQIFASNGEPHNGMRAPLPFHVTILTFTPRSLMQLHPLMYESQQAPQNGFRRSAVVICSTELLICSCQNTKVEQPEIHAQNLLICIIYEFFNKRIE